MGVIWAGMSWAKPSSPDTRGGVDLESDRFVGAGEAVEAESVTLVGVEVVSLSTLIVKAAVGEAVGGSEVGAGDGSSFCGKTATGCCRLAVGVIRRIADGSCWVVPVAQPEQINPTRQRTGKSDRSALSFADMRLSYQ